MPTPFLCLITGQWFRPPAKQVLAVLSAGTALSLVAESDNPYDPQAVKVMFQPRGGISEAAFSQLDSELLNCGMTLEMLMSGGEIQLGYLAASGGKPLAKARAAGEVLTGNAEVFEAVLAQQASACLAFGPDGSPRALVTVQEEAGDPS